MFHEYVCGVADLVPCCMFFASLQFLMALGNGDVLPEEIQLILKQNPTLLPAENNRVSQDTFRCMSREIHFLLKPYIFFRTG